MSLKAKLEAVIYAAEEPVTLAQLAVLFTADALAWMAERAAASAQEAADSASHEVETSGPAPLLSAEFDYLGLDNQIPEAEQDDQPAPAEEQSQPVPELLAGPASDAGAESSSDSAPVAPPEGEPKPEADTESEGRRLARQRDREVRATIRQILDELIAFYASDDRGIEIREIAGGYRMATKPECHDAVRAFVKSLKPALKLSLPALETLAVIAYKQPVTAPEVNEIRGVDSSGVFGSLLARKLIATAGRKQVIGRPILYKTTREFLLRFGLKDVAELPSMEEFEKMAAIELDEPEPQTGPIRTSSSNYNPSLDLDESADEEPESAEEETEDEAESLAPANSLPAETDAMSASHEPTTPAEAAPAAPPSTEQEETENSHNVEENHQDREDAQGAQDR